VPDADFRTGGEGGTMAQNGMRTGLIGTFGVVCAIAVAGLISVLPADAQDWNPFARDTLGPSYAPAQDRQFIKEWESQPPKGFPTLSPSNIAAMQTAIAKYTSIVAAGGWPRVPDVFMESGSQDPAVAILRERLRISGDLLETSSFLGGFDFYVEKAVKRFQASNGLTPTGVVDKRTIAALNIPAQARLKQLKSNLARIQELARSTGKKYVLVNIPSQQIEAVEGDQVFSRHAGVVGKIDRPTPILRSAIHELNFNPVWHLPPTVITKDLIPKGREMQRAGQSVLVKFGIDAYGGDGRKLDPAKVDFNSPIVQGLTYRQQPGKENPLGFLKINFHNNYSVYMHDSPSETLFGRNVRTASSGCVRVHGIERLAAWLLADAGWNEQRVVGMKTSGETVTVRLKKPVPLLFAYITAWATADGVVQFRRDMYQKDGLGEVASAY
jgi:murein L,D-transpeptidase YcbB/YkuD